MSKHKWIFSSRFRRHAFGWRSQPAIKRIKEAVSEIKKVARKNPILGAEGAVLFLEKVSPAIERVDSSSGVISTAVNRTIVEFASIIAEAPANAVLREEWLNRLWQAIENDDMPYLELLINYWGELCATELHASRWANEFIDMVRTNWNPNTPVGWFNGTCACMSTLYKAQRYDELLELVALDPHNSWDSRIWAVKALAAQGKEMEAIQYAEATDDQYANPVSVARTCEEILLLNGKVEYAYSKYAFAANRKTTNLATFRAIAAKYSDKDKTEILRYLVAQTPDEEGKWFAAAKSVGLYNEAIELVNRTPCDPKTLTRAARDFVEKEPLFAVEAGVAALRWLLAGYGYDIIGLDVSNAYFHTMAAAINADSVSSTKSRIALLLKNASADGMFCAKIIGPLMAHDHVTPERHCTLLP